MYLKHNYSRKNIEESWSKRRTAAPLAAETGEHRAPGTAAGPPGCAVQRVVRDRLEHHVLEPGACSRACEGEAGKAQELHLCYGKQFRRLFSCFVVRVRLSCQSELLLLRLMAAVLSGDVAWANRTLVQGLFAFVISDLLCASINKVLLNSTSTVWSNLWLILGCLQRAVSLLELAHLQQGPEQLLLLGTWRGPPLWGELNPSSP